MCNAHLGVSVKTGTSDNIGTHRTPFSTMSEIRSYTYWVCVGAPSIYTYQASSKLNANYDLAPNDSGCWEFYQINVNQYWLYGPLFFLHTHLDVIVWTSEISGVKWREKKIPLFWMLSKVAIGQVHLKLVFPRSSWKTSINLFKISTLLKLLLWHCQRKRHTLHAACAVSS